MTDSISFKLSRPILVNIFLILLYFGSVIWSIVIGIYWICSNPSYSLYFGEEFMSDYVGFAVFPIMLISFAPIELFFAILALIIYKCCPNKIAFKVFVWLAAVFSLAPIITHAAAIPQTSPQKCYHIYNHTFEYKKPDVADGCFGANVLNTSILPFYILTHLLVLIQIIMKDYGFSNQADVSSQPIANEKDQYYAEKPSFQLPPQQPAPAYSQFY